MPFDSYHSHLMWSVLYMNDNLIIFGDHDIYKTIFASMNQYFNDKLSLFLTEVSFDISVENQQSYFENGHFFKMLWWCHEPYNQVKFRLKNENDFWTFS